MFLATFDICHGEQSPRETRRVISRSQNGMLNTVARLNGGCRMKMMTLISVTSKWLCATGVAVVASYCILTRSSNSRGTADGRQKASQVASSLSKSGTIPEY